jgi:predicted lysophospholipase L1 biosynthesis ABC-type transport system permease subunit
MATQTVPSAPQQQIQLPLSKAWQISLKSIKIRLARSMITASGILLGIAFFSSVRAVGLFPITQTGAAALAAEHRHQFLAIMALVVCFVGIMNSMLMSVTERFKEIGTMKCLGALDRFIVTLFFIEAALMAVIATILGWVIGWLIMVVIHLFSDGAKVFTSAFWAGSGVQFLQSLGISVAITLIAAIPPAIRAAKMPPAMALRSEI